MLSLSLRTSNSRICQESDQYALRRAASIEENLLCASDTAHSEHTKDCYTRPQEPTSTTATSTTSSSQSSSCDEWARSWLGDQYTPSDEEDDSDFADNSDNNYDEDDCNRADCDPEQRVPFWFSNEEPSHAQQVVKEYSRFLNLVEPNKGSRQLPTFVGRIERQPVVTFLGDGDDTLSFTTLDVVGVYRRDMRQVGSTVTAVEQTVILTTWDEDGVPMHFSLRKDAALRDWQHYHKFSNPSFIYCLPVWYTDHEYSYEVCSIRKDVGYSKEPFNFTKYIPQHYRPCVESLCG